MQELDPKWIRVSTILAMIPSQNMAGKWEYPMGKIDPFVLERKANLGTSVHEAIYADSQDKFCAISDKEDGYLDSYLKWKREIKLKPIHSEQRLFHEPMRLTGCVDMIAKFGIDDDLCLIDFKCTVAEDPVKWQLQAAFYHFLACHANIPVNDRCFFVKLDPEGKMPKVYQYWIGKELTATALSFYNAYTFLTRKYGSI